MGDPAELARKLIDRASRPTGPEDHEATAAAVQACALIARHGLLIVSVAQVHANHVPEPFPHVHVPPAPEPPNPFRRPTPGASASAHVAETARSVFDLFGRIVSSVVADVPAREPAARRVRVTQEAAPAPKKAKPREKRLAKNKRAASR